LFKLLNLFDKKRIILFIFDVLKKFKTSFEKTLKLDEIYIFGINNPNSRDI